MKKVLITLCLLSSTIFFALNAQTALSTAAAPSFQAMNKYYAIITTKSPIKETKINSIEIMNMEDVNMRNALGGQFDVIYKARLSPSNATFMQILNLFAMQGFYVVATSTANTDSELITTYTLCINL